MNLKTLMAACPNLMLVAVGDAPKPAARHIIFDKPLREGSGWAVTLGKPYLLELVNEGQRLYFTYDDHGKRLNVTLFARSLTNGGYWHLLEDEATIRAQA